jgi:hypothetical protein
MEKILTCSQTFHGVSNGRFDGMKIITAPDIPKTHGLVQKNHTDE